MSGSTPLRAIKGAYPGPASTFTADDVVETLWTRYTRHRRGGEPLTGMGYFCLSVLQADAGGRGRASTKFAIHRDVLDKAIPEK